MGLFQRLAVLCILSWFSCLILIQVWAQSPARITDSLLRDYAFRALSNPKTGIIFDGTVPANLTGIKVSALRLRSGSLRGRGVRYKEFRIPAGVDETPYVERLVLVYQNMGNWSSYFYELDGYVHLTPVLGLLAYDASNLSATSLPELDIRALEKPISVKFAYPIPAPKGYVPKCAWFALHGLVSFSNVTSGDTCLTYKQGHFSIVVESITPAPSAIPAVQPGPSRHGGKEINSDEWIIVGSVAGGLALVMLMSFIILCALRCEQKKKMRRMEKASEVSESLRMTSVGTSKAPTASCIRTQPTLESEHVS